MENRLLPELCNPIYNVGLVPNVRASKFPTGWLIKYFKSLTLSLIISKKEFKS